MLKLLPGIKAEPKSNIITNTVLSGQWAQAWNTRITLSHGDMQTVSLAH